MSSAHWQTTSCISSVNGSYSAPIAGYYSDGNYVRYWNGSSLGSFTACNTLSSPTPTPTPTPSPSPSGLYCDDCFQYTFFGGINGTGTYFIYQNCVTGVTTNVFVGPYSTTVVCSCENEPYKPPQSGDGSISGGSSSCSGGTP